jgi:hypothetical protein
MLARKLKDDSNFDSWMKAIEGSTIGNSNNLISADEFKTLVFACTNSPNGKTLVLDFRRNNLSPENDVVQLTSELAGMAFQCVVAENDTSKSNEVLYSALRGWLFPSANTPDYLALF